MEKFLFDTWYGAFVVLCGTSVLLVVCFLFEFVLAMPRPVTVGVRPLAAGIWLTCLLVQLVSVIIFFAAWIVSILRRQWKRAVLQAVLGVVWVVAFCCAISMLIFFTMFFPIEDHFADELTIPPEVAANIVEPESGCEISLFSTADVYDDDFATSVFRSLANEGGEDTTVTCDLSGLADLVHNRRDELMEYLACHPGWWLHEDHGRLCATRRLRLRGVWNHPLHGYYSGNSRMRHENENYESYDRKTHYQTRTTIGFPHSPFGRDGGAEHPAVCTANAVFESGTQGTFASCMRFGDQEFCVEVFEESATRERRITNAAMSFLKAEFTELKLPADAAMRGPEEFTLRNGMQPGIYNLTVLLNPGESGVTYLKAYEVTKGTRLSESRLYGSSNERMGWSQDPEEKFLYENEFTIYEGDWGKPYAVRIEVWFRPDSGKPERKLAERTCKIEGWQR